MQLTEYMQILTDQIRCKKAHPMIVEEYKAHIQDQVEAYVQDGMEKEKALETAIAQMGDPVEAGVALDRVHKPKMCASLMVTIFVLTLIGIVAQFVIFKDVNNYSVKETYFIRSIVYNLVGFAVMALICYLDYSFLSRHIVSFYVGWYLLVMFISSLTNVFSLAINYSAQQVYLYQLLAFFPLTYAGILFHYRNQGRKGFFKAALLFLLAVPLIAGCNKISGCVELYTVTLVLWTVAFIKGWYGAKGKRKAVILWILATLIPIGIILITLAGPNDTYRTVRLKAYLNPAAYAGEEGYMFTQIQDVVEKLRLFGTTTTLEGMLPNTYNDFIILSIFSYFGIIIGLIVCAFILFFFMKALGISLKQKNQLAQIIGIACVMELLMRTLIYMATNFGLCPFAQMNMPFLSFGFTGTLVNSVLTGFLLSIYRYENVLGEKQMDAKFRYKFSIEKISSN